MGNRVDCTAYTLQCGGGADQARRDDESEDISAAERKSIAEAHSTVVGGMIRRRQRGTQHCWCFITNTDPTTNTGPTLSSRVSTGDRAAPDHPVPFLIQTGSTAPRRERRPTPTAAPPDGPVRHPGLKLRTPAHTKQLGWYVEFESRGSYASSQRAALGVSTQWPSGRASEQEGEGLRAPPRGAARLALRAASSACPAPGRRPETPSTAP